MAPVRFLSVFGTRPEAIKMAPVVRALAGLPGVAAPVCLTGQHREMLAQVTRLFGLRAEADLDLMRPGQGPGQVTAAVMAGLAPVLARLRPDCMLVHGDTATTLGAALGTPVLVTRDTTERPEAVAAGTAVLVGTDPARILTEATRLLDDPAAHGAMARATNPFGDGHAATRIAAGLVRTFADRAAEALPAA